MLNKSLTKAFKACAFTMLAISSPAETRGNLKSTAACPVNDSKIKSLPIEFSQEFLGKSALGLDQNKAEEREILNRLYAHYNIQADTKYLQWELPRRIAFLKSLSGDPLLVKARSNWAALPVNERKDAATRIHRYQAQAYNFTAANFNFYSDGVKPGTTRDMSEPASANSCTNAAPKMKSIQTLISGFYNSNNNMFYINTFNTGQPGFNTYYNGAFADFAGLLAHEGDHGLAAHLWQDYTASAKGQGKIDPLVKDMAALLYNTHSGNAYMTTEVSGFSSYLSNPTEVNARYLQDTVSFYLRLGDKDQQAFIGRLEEKLKNLTVYNAAIERQTKYLLAKNSAATLAAN